MRRKKKLIRLLIILIIIAVFAFCLFFFISPILSYLRHKNFNNKTNSQSNNGEILNVTTVTEPNVQINLPDKINDINSDNNGNSQVDSNNEKKYTPILESSERYLITTLSNNELSILIGDDSEPLLNNSNVQVGLEYKVSGISETISSDFYFSIDNYDYPIVLLLGESGKLYYVDIENAYKTGNFTVDGYIKNIPPVKTVSKVTVERNGKEYRSAVITCTNGEGYEFNINMIGR